MPLLPWEFSSLCLIFRGQLCVCAHTCMSVCLRQGPMQHRLALNF